MKHDDKTTLIFKHVIDQFKELRIAKGLSHTALAKKIGMTRPAISHIEKNKRKPSLMAALRVAQGLEKNLSDIVRKAEKLVLKK